MGSAALVISVLALVFTVASFWWLYARAGWLEAAAPRAYGFTSRVRLRLPLAFFNTGAKALIVSDLRLLLDDSEWEPLPWIITRRTMRAEHDDHALATPFSVPGRGTEEVIAEFGHDRGWAPAESSHHRIRLEAANTRRTPGRAFSLSTGGHRRQRNRWTSTSCTRMRPGGSPQTVRRRLKSPGRRAPSVKNRAYWKYEIEREAVFDRASRRTRSSGPVLMGH
jgi:hypothetical protein